ncbi:unnamed protein product, partial [Mesorhabditis belari]|uniref:Potassium channel tetramerisation-type BTB domain-containing protein n=1 Tax=Mesorhabditis belari TaxID=2138241 RepID=A0AAF3JBY7_9BILA
MIGLANDIINFNVGGKKFSTFRKTFPKDTPFYKWFVTGTKEVPFVVRENEFFIDRDPKTFSVILNYFRLKTAGQLWEACLPKDPDRLALLTQEAEYFNLPQLRDQAINLLQSSCEEKPTNYIHEVLARSSSCPQGFNSPIAD